MTDFADWLVRTAHKRGLDSEADISRAVGTSQSIVGRWRRHGAVPEVKTLRRVAEGLGVSIQEALVAAGHVKPEEVGLIKVEASLDSIPTRDLLTELARRLGEDELIAGSEIVAMRSSCPADSDEPTWHPEQ